MKKPLVKEQVSLDKITVSKGGKVSLTISYTSTDTSSVQVLARLAALEGDGVEMELEAVQGRLEL